MENVQILINSLNCMEFQKSKYGIRLPDSIFKTANRLLFQRIVCFALSQIGDFDEFVGKYEPSWPLSTKEEAQFRSSLKEIVTTINSLYPGEIYVKPINQSFLIAPQGPKVIEFLASLCKVSLSICLKRAGLEFTPPSYVEELLDVDESEESVDINIRMERAEENLRQAYLNETKSFEEFNSFIKQPSVVEMLGHESELDIVEKMALNSQQNLISNVQTAESNIEKMKLLLNKLFGIIDSFGKLKKSIYYSFDGMTFLENVGFKSNLSAKVNDVELISNGMLDLNSLFKAVLAKYNYLNEYVKIHGSSALKSREEELKRELIVFDEISSSFKEAEIDLDKVISVYSPIVMKYQDEALEIINRSDHPLHIKFKDYLNFERDIKENMNTHCVIPYDEIPLPKDPVAWVIGDIREKFDDSIIGSTKKSNVKLTRNLSFSGRTLPNSMSKRKIISEDKFDKDIFKGVLFKGLCQDRRATLASPSARKERFRIKHFDEQRKPLKPITAKGLFSSSPLGHNSAKSSTTLDLSPVTSLIEVQDLSASSLAQGCGMSLHKSFSEPNLNNMSQELLKFECISSDSEDDSIQPFTTSISATNPQTSQHNDSIDLLIQKFESARKKLNLSE